MSNFSKSEMKRLNLDDVVTEKKKTKKNLPSFPLILSLAGLFVVIVMLCLFVKEQTSSITIVLPPISWDIIALLIGVVGVSALHVVWKEVRK